MGKQPYKGQIFLTSVLIPFNADAWKKKACNYMENKTDLSLYVQDVKELKTSMTHLMTIPSFKASFQKVLMR